MSSTTSLDTGHGSVDPADADADGHHDVAVDHPADADAPAAATTTAVAGAGWVRVCRLDQLSPDRGRAALVGACQIALFRLSGDRGVHAVGNRDPFSGAQVLSRGLVGDAGGVPKVASPVFKQSFDLRTGVCLDDPGNPDVAVPAYPVRVEDGWVLVELPPSPSP
jgi:nitrite reductase (NADH) small subunit